MSRCFPFPPPGYEGKHKPENLDLLKEAKRKEKKHKKEKKDKERKKDKEKDKDGGDEKHKERKDRKEKHKDKKDKHKKKDKEDRGKEKEKSSISEESVVAGKVEEQSGGKLHSKAHIIQSQNGGKPLHSSPLPSQGIEDSKFVQELNRRNQDEKKGRGTQLPEKVAPMDRKDQEMAAIAAVRNSSVVWTEVTDDYKNKRVDPKMDPQGLGSECSGNTIFPNVNLMSQSKVEKISRPMGGQNGRKWLDKEKYKETNDVNQGHKPKDKENHGKEKDKEKGKKKKVAEVKSKHKKPEHDQLKDDVRNNPDGIINNEGRGPVFSNNNAANDASIRKRKNTDTNGFLHDNEIRPNKIPKLAPHQLGENGRKPVDFRTPSKPPHDKHVNHNSIQVEKRDQLANGLVEAQRPSPSKPNSSVATVTCDKIAESSKLRPEDSKILEKGRKVLDVEDQIAEASRRPHHPDSKYLAEVLAVPMMAEWSDIDDDEWLLSKKGPSNKPKVELSEVRKDPCVWSEAVHIESADIYALPYVIPY